ncbi:MAG: hypothetical protein JXR48_06675 [Candidatus Delongbacteria bacterium]|nr:hypothetical protein [Candidatus Delongbacteria bacterium]MBN2834635.1 hypothetical protein [Candidatus Delongbacteria bacterium]
MKNNDFYMIYFYIVNYDDLRDSFELNSTFYANEILNLAKGFVDESYEVVNIDNRSILFKISEDFEEVLKVSSKLKNCLDYIYDLNIDSEFRVYPSFAIVLSSEVRFNPFKKMTIQSRDQLETMKDSGYFVTKKVYLKNIQDYKFESYLEDKFYTTNGLRVYEYEKLESIFLDREAMTFLKRFSVSDMFKLFILYGEIGTGKTYLVDRFLEESGTQYFTVKVKASKNYESVFEPIVKITGQLLPDFDEMDSSSLDEIEDLTKLDNLDDFTKENMSDLIKTLYFGYESKTTNTDFNNLYLRTALLFRDALEINYKHFNKPIMIFVDNQDSLSDDSLSIFLSVLEACSTIPVKMIMAGYEDPENLNINCSYQKKELENYTEEEVRNYLKLVFEKKQITKNFQMELLAITDGNPYTLKEYLSYLFYNNKIVYSGKYVKLDNYSLSEFSENLMDLFEEKIKFLDKNSTNLLKMFSIFGNDVKKSDLDSLLHNLNYPYEIQDGLDTLIKSGLVRQNENNFESLETHILRYLYDSVNEVNRKKIHDMIGKIYENRQSSKYSFNTFFHFYKAENFDKIVSIQSDLLKQAYRGLNYHSLNNIIRLTDKFFNTKLESPDDTTLNHWFQNKMYKVKTLREVNDGIIKEFDFVLKYLYSNQKFEMFVNISLEMANVYLDDKQYKKFLTIVNRALEVAVNEKFVRSEADLMSLYAKYYIINEDVENFKPMLKKAITLYDAFNLKKEDIEVVQDSLSIYYYYIKKYDKCIESSKILLGKYEENLDVSRMLPVMEMLATCYLYRKDYLNSEKLYNTLYNYYSKLGEYELKKEIEIKLCELMSFNDKHKSSLEMLDRLIGENSVAHNLLTKYYELAGRICIYLKDYERAFNYLSMANKVANESEEKDLVFRSEIALGSLHIHLSDFKLSREHYVKAKKMYKSGYNSTVAKLYLGLSDFATSGLEEKEYLDILAMLNDELNTDPDVKFKVILLLIEILYANKHYIKLKQLIPEAKKYVDVIYDHNLITKFKNFEREIVRIHKKVKILSNPNERMIPDVKKRVDRRRRFV